MLTLDSDRFLILGHRGASAHAPENTVRAFRKAAEQGADGVELDVRRTADGLLIVHHDAVIGGGEAIFELTGEELRARRPNIATFAEAMAACEGLLVNIEIKNSPGEPDFDPDESVAEAVVAWVVEHDWQDRVVISSFHPDTVDRVHELRKEVATGQLIRTDADVLDELEATHKRGHKAVHPPGVSLVGGADLAEAATQLGMWLFAWTVDEPDAIVALRQAGVTGVVTNDPAAAAAALAS